ncbi:PIN domain-containing protein [Candidatus Woesearchaeota archaeon]|nr:PIN domain-containing protein [Candidatus Woesearchaeota archaeon]
MKDESIFIDTNILLYAIDEIDQSKHQKAKKLIEESFRKRRNFTASIQVLGEFFNASTKKLKTSLSKEESKEFIDYLIKHQNWEIKKQEKTTLMKAIDLSIKYNNPFWDSLIAATMIENGLTKIYTENTKDFEKIKEIEAINPLI